MQSSFFNFEELKVYQKSIDFINDVYVVTKKFPKEEMYGLASQFTRAANSIALNIAEGSGDSNLQFIRFLKISTGSVKECVVCVTISKNQYFISQDDYENLRLKLEELSKMLSGLINYLKNQNSIK